MTKTSTRHKWGEPVRFQYKTERTCKRCPIVKVSRHEAEGPFDRHWIEWWRGGEQIMCEATPRCDVSFEAWCAELKFVAEEIYSNFEVCPDHWRDCFDAGETAAAAFERILQMVADGKARKAAS